MPAIRETPTEDEVTKYGSTIFWSRKHRDLAPTRACPGRTLEYVPVRCSCGREFEIYSYELLRKPTARLPLCRWCAVWITRRKGQDHQNWQGGIKFNAAGYVLIHVSALSQEERDLFGSMALGSTKIYIPEHRLIMARKLSRPLKREEHVHHANGIKHDNRPENLVLIDRADHGHETEALIVKVARLENELKTIQTKLHDRGIALAELLAD